MSRDVPRIFVQPTPGLTIRFPGDPRRVLHPDGEWVPEDGYWTRRLRVGVKGHVDCVRATPPTQPPTQTKEG